MAYKSLYSNLAWHNAIVMRCDLRKLEKAKPQYCIYPCSCHTAVMYNIPSTRAMQEIDRTVWMNPNSNENVSCTLPKDRESLAVKNHLPFIIHYGVQCDL